MKNVVGILSAAAMLLGVSLAFQAAAATETVITESSFGCMHTGTKIRKTYIRHADPAKLKEAVRIFENKVEGVEYPEGTILQLVPNEVMVKAAKKDFPNTNGWEFFLLDVSATGTKIAARGEIAGNPGGTCLGCHQAGAKFDYVCEKDHGCAPIPVTDEQILAAQGKDPRCTAQ